jgi:octaprenyl-diphosphate synthase
MVAVKTRVESASPRQKFDSLTDLLSEDLQRVESTLDEFLAPQKSQFPELYAHLAVYKGKRLRPMLTLLTAHALQGGIRNQHYVASAVVELIHTATLVHDDVLDEATTRRRLATPHTRWGNKAAILLGDMLFSMAYHQASRTGDAKIGEMIGEATTRVCAGEMSQSLSEQGWDLQEKDYYSIIDGKTAALTECACRLAGHISRAKPQVTEQLAGFGRELGLAFQISDDLLDIAGDAKVVGKTLGTDLLQKKATLPVIRFLNQASETQKAIFQEHFADRQIVRTIFRELGIFEQVGRVVDQHILKAKDYLNCLPHSIYRSALEKVAEWCLLREC